MQTLVALKPMRYARRDLRAGDRFEAPAVDAGYLIRHKFASAAPQAAEAPQPVFQRQQPAQRGRPRIHPVQAPRTEEAPQHSAEVGSGEEGE